MMTGKDEAMLLGRSLDKAIWPIADLYQSGHHADFDQKFLN
jgi:hypothetical protein